MRKYHIQKQKNPTIKMIGFLYNEISLIYLTKEEFPRKSALSEIASKDFCNLSA